MASLDILMKIIANFIVSYGLKILYVIIILVLGFWFIRMFRRALDRRMTKRKTDPSLRHFLIGFISIALKILLLITAASMLGIATTSFVAIIGAAGLAFGFALQGSLANFAGGVLILLFKPFKVGDYISAQGFDGTVKKIEVFNTILTSVDNKTIILPNGQLSNSPVTNYSREKLRRVDLTFGIGYDDDLKKAQKTIEGIVSKHKLILKEPASFVRVSELGDSSVNFAVRLWCKKEDYWIIYFDMIEAVKLSFDKAKISIPYPQMDIHMTK